MKPDPCHSMPDDERISEIAEIFAAGLLRLKLKKSSHLFAPGGESLLDCAAHQSSHADRLNSDEGSRG